MRMLAGIPLVLVVAVLGLAEKARFDGHKVLNIIPRRVRDVNHIAEMEDEFKLDFWNFPRHMNDSFHVRVAPHTLEPFLARLRDMDAEVSVWIDDVQRLVDLEERQRKKRQATENPDPLYNYLDADQIKKYVEDKAFANDNMELSYLGVETYLGRQIQVVKIVSRNGEADRSIFIDCGIHAREWISPSFCLFAIDMLLSEEEPSFLLDNYNWHIVPVLNPDGYYYSHASNRMWRKNRRDNGAASRCDGVDLNRNFGYMFNASIGGSTSTCSDIYVGSGPFSEAESSGVRNYILDNQSQNFVSYLTVHSYGQMWLHPWGYTSVLPDDVADLDMVGNAAKDALRELYGTVYRVGSSTNILYSAAGGSDDWAKGGAGIKYSYTLELRDQGQYGFTLPESQILPTVMETWAGVREMATKILEL